MMNCKNALRRMPHFIDGSLSERRDARIAGHLARCRPCDGAYASLLDAEAGLRGMGSAIRAGAFVASPARLPAEPTVIRRQRPAWGAALIPMWAPVGALAAAAVLVVVLTTAPDGLSVSWGPPKAATAARIEAPPPGSLAMLEFLIVADPDDAGRLAASVTAVEEFLTAHPDDVAMHAKLAKLYTYQLDHPDTPNNLRDSTRERLTVTRERLSVLLATPRALGVKQ
jgi:anti-sigma factor RsiW